MCDPSCDAMQLSFMQIMQMTPNVIHATNIAL